jgi:uncharacterized protein YodC (DUF2158 family)
VIAAQDFPGIGAPRGFAFALGHAQSAGSNQLAQVMKPRRFVIVAARPDAILWTDRFSRLAMDLSMTVIKSGDLVTLKSGGPAMTVDTVNTDILDDNKITGVLCVWFVGDKLQRVRFDHRAIEPVSSAAIAPGKEAGPPEETSGDYKTVLDEMVVAMNIPVDAKREISRPAKRRKPARAAKYDPLTESPVVSAN